MTTSTETEPALRPRGESSTQGQDRTGDATGQTPVARGRTATVNLPFVTAEFRVPRVGVPHVSVPRVSVPRVGRPHISPPQVNLPQVGRREVAHAAGIGVSYLPPPERLAYYAGLGALAVAGLIEWPVAVAIGAGTVVAQRAGRQHRHRPSERVGADGPRRATETPAESTASTKTAKRTGSTGAAETSERARRPAPTAAPSAAQAPPAASAREAAKRTTPTKRTPRKTTR